MTREFTVDESDQATEQEMMVRNLTIAIIRSRKEELHATGTCHNCDELVEYPKKFCDGDCAADYERFKRLA